jgi:poly(hydroxyalkanoate) granule-associated protein
MSEEVEVQVRQIDDTSGMAENAPATELMRRLLLASIGAVAVTYDEAEKFIQRLVDRGELAQKDGEKVMNEMMGRLRQKAPTEDVQATDLGSRMEDSFEQFLNRMNVPSKRDIDELSAKIAQLSARVEEVQRTKPEPKTDSKSQSKSQS